MDLGFQSNLLKLWGWDESVSNAWLLELDERKFWETQGRKVLSVSVFPQRISNPNAFLLDLMLENQAIKLGIFEQSKKLLLEIFEHFKVFKPRASKKEIKLLKLNKRSLSLMLKKSIFDDCGGSLYIQDLEVLMYMPQDFTFCLIVPKNPQSGFEKFQHIVGKNGFFLYE